MGKLLTQRIWTFQQGVWMAPWDTFVGKMEKCGQDSSSTWRFVASWLNAWAKGLVGGCPSREKVLAVTISTVLPLDLSCFCSTLLSTCMKCGWHVYPICSWPRSGKHSDLISHQNQNQNRLPGQAKTLKSQPRHSRKALHLCLKRTNGVYYGIIRNLLSWRSLCKPWDIHMISVYNPVMWFTSR